MANNYLQFCVEIPLFPEKMEITKELFDRIENIDYYLDENLETEESLKELLGYPLLKAIHNEHLCLSTEFEKESIYIFAEEFGNLETAALIIQLLIKRQLVNFAKLQQPYILLTWAETCDKCRPDDFAGGAVMISKMGIEWMPNPNEWATITFEKQLQTL